MLATIILCLGSFREGYQQADVEVCELNHVVHEQTGENKFTQVILWRWQHHIPYPRFVVTEYFLIDSRPRIEWHNGKKRVTWRARNGEVYDASCRTFYETKTIHDPEMEDRKVVSEQRRRPYFGM